MSPASYLTAPPRVAGGSLPPSWRPLLRQDQLRAALEDPRCVRDLGQQPVQLRPLLGADAREEPLLDLRDRALGSGNVRLALLRQLDDVTAAVGSVAPPHNQS